MRTCSDCKETKNFSEFYVKTKTALQSKCKVCHNKYLSKRWKDRKILAIKMKGGSCSKCGYDRYIGALDFHHRDKDQKLMGWTKMKQVSNKSFLAELEKCDLLCANCHREVHADDYCSIH